MNQPQREQSFGWCSLRFRFDERELTLLKAAEQVRGVALATRSRPDVLRTALSLAKAGQKLSVAAPGASVSLEEAEVGLLLEALHFAVEELQWAFKTHDEHDTRRRDAVLTAFPELTDRGAYRSYGLGRELDALAARLHGALSA